MTNYEMIKKMFNDLKEGEKLRLCASIGEGIAHKGYIVKDIAINNVYCENKRRESKKDIDLGDVTNRYVILYGRGDVAIASNYIKTPGYSEDNF